MKRLPDDSPPTLSRLAGEVREQPEPEIDWDAVEERLLSDLESGKAPRYRLNQRHPALVGALSLAAAAAVALVVWRPVSAPSTTVSDVEVASDEIAPRSLQGSELEVGQRLTTGTRALSVEHPGLGRWLLEENSSAEVRSNAEKVVVQLQSGSLTATIVPSARPETFVVEVGKVRVAVHGTEFSVLRDADQAYVVVRQGVVQVSTEGQPNPTVLEAPASGRFQLTGDEAGRALEASGGVRSGRRQAAAAASTSKAQEPEPPKDLTFSDVERGLSAVEHVLSACLLESTDTHGKVSVSLETRVALRINGSGVIERHDFSPPLAPAVEACAKQRFESVRFAQSVNGAHVVRDLAIQRH